MTGPIRDPNDRPILAAVDFSADSEAALLAALALAAEAGAPLVVLHVVHDPAETPGTYARSDASGNQMRIEEAAAEMLDEFLARLRAAHPDLEGLDSIETTQVVGLPATRILEVSEQIGAARIVMGSRGLKGLGRLLNGSIAEQVLRGASVPVTVVKSSS